MAAQSEPLFWTPDILSDTREDSSILVWQKQPLGPYPQCVTERSFTGPKPRLTVSGWRSTARDLITLPHGLARLQNS